MTPRTRTEGRRRVRPRHALAPATLASYSRCAQFALDLRSVCAIRRADCVWENCARGPPLRHCAVAQRGRDARSHGAPSLHPESRTLPRLRRRRGDRARRSPRANLRAYGRRLCAVSRRGRSRRWRRRWRWLAPHGFVAHALKFPVKRTAIKPEHLRSKRFVPADRFEHALDIPTLDFVHRKKLGWIVTFNGDPGAFEVANFFRKIV